MDYKPSTVKDWCLASGSPYRVLLPSREDVTYGPSYGTLSFGPQNPILLHEEYVAEIPNCAVVGGFEGAFVGDHALMDILFRPRVERYYVTAAPWGPDYADTTVVRIDPHIGGCIPTGILLQSWFGPSCYHWIVEHLSKLMLIEMDNIPPDIPLLIDDRVLSTPSYIEMLSTITTRPIVPLAPRTRYMVGLLYFPSPPCLPPTIRDWEVTLEPGDVPIRREAIEFLRNRLSVPGTGDRRLFIDRQNEPTRLVNKTEVAQVFSEFGFEPIRPETLSFRRQQEMFASAAVIAGQSGAGLTNVLLAPSSASLICLQAQAWQENPYADLAGYGGQSSLFIVGDMVEGSSGQQAQFTVDPASLRTTLARVLA
jgi:Glycosyltransferase 61